MVIGIRVLVLLLSLPVWLIGGEKTDDSKKKVVLIAGRDSHALGEHEFRAGCLLLQNALNKSNMAINAVCVFEGWPQDTKVFEDAAAIVIYCGGGKKHPILSHWSDIEPLIKKGVGLGCIHYAVHVPPGEKGGDRFMSWIGGFYETGFSINPHWTANAELSAGNPVTRGVSAFSVHDEWYFSIRFPENKQGWTSILKAIPDEEARSGSTSSPRGPLKHIVDARGHSETLMWTLERPDGGRGFGFTGGHYHKNWADDNQRKLVLNAIAWIAKIEVPEMGIPSMTPTAEAMKENMKAPKTKDREPGK